MSRGVGFLLGFKCALFVHVIFCNRAPITSGSFAERDLQFEVSYVSSPPADKSSRWRRYCPRLRRCWWSTCLTHEKSPIYFEKSPIYSEKSPIYSEKSFHMCHWSHRYVRHDSLTRAIWHTSRMDVEGGRTSFGGPGAHYLYTSFSAKERL